MPGKQFIFVESMTGPRTVRLLFSPDCFFPVLLRCRR
jgi:hypothetical protein